MKKIQFTFALSVLMMILLSNPVFAGGALKIGVNMPGDHEVSVSNASATADVETGFSFGGEIFKSLNKNIDLGGGITFQLPRSQEDYQGNFNFIPVYGMVRIKYDAEQIAPYFVGQLGYNFFLGDSDYKGTGIYESELEGGLYYGLGGGIIFKKRFLVELLYSVNNGSVDYMDTDFDIEYTMMTLNFGFTF